MVYIKFNAISTASELISKFERRLVALNLRVVERIDNETSRTITLIVNAEEAASMDIVEHLARAGLSDIGVKTHRVYPQEVENLPKGS
jgi:hypothetical protein